MPGLTPHNKQLRQLLQDSHGSGDGLRYCPTGGAPQVLRHSSRNGSQFWGCSRFPYCRTAEAINA